IYLCDVVSTTRGSLTFNRPGLSTQDSVCLMIDDNPLRPRNQWRSVVWAQEIGVTGTGVTMIASAPSKQELIDQLQATNLTNGMRNTLNSWLTGGGYTTLPAGQQSQYDAVMFVCRQVNPAVDLTVLVE